MGTDDLLAKEMDLANFKSKKMTRGRYRVPFNISDFNFNKTRFGGNRGEPFDPSKTDDLREGGRPIAPKLKKREENRPNPYAVELNFSEFDNLFDKLVSNSRRSGPSSNEPDGENMGSRSGGIHSDSTPTPEPPEWDSTKEQGASRPPSHGIRPGPPSSPVESPERLTQAPEPYVGDPSGAGKTPDAPGSPLHRINPSSPSAPGVSPFEPVPNKKSTEPPMRSEPTGDQGLARPRQPKMELDFPSPFEDSPTEFSGKTGPRPFPRFEDTKVPHSDGIPSYPPFETSDPAIKSSAGSKTPLRRFGEDPISRDGDRRNRLENLPQGEVDPRRVLRKLREIKVFCRLFRKFSRCCR